MVDGGPELQNDDDVESPFVLEADPPDRVAVPLMQVSADVAGGQRVQGPEVERVAPATNER